MTIKEIPVVNFLRFEIWDTATRDWRNLNAKATQVNFKRGGDRNGASNTMSVGTLDATLYGAVNLATETALKPNSRIRVLRTGSVVTKTEFTGTVLDISQSIDLDTATGQKSVYTSLYCVDAVQSLANTDRFGALSGNGLGYETWPDRITRLAGSSLVPVALPSREDPIVSTWNGTDATQFNGSTGTTTSQSSTIAASYAYVAGDRPAVRVRHVRTGAAIAWAFSPFLSNYYYLSGLKIGQTYAATMTVTAAVMTRATAGTMSLKAKDAKLNVIGQSSPVVLSAAGDEYTLGITFVATTSTAFTQLSTDSTFGFTTETGSAEVALDFRGMQVTKVADPNGYQLQDVAYEASLASHFDLACNSVGARWWVDKLGTVQFRRQFDLTSPVLTFSDKPNTTALLAGAGTLPGATALPSVTTDKLSYTGLEQAYDTRNLVNTVKLNQHGYNRATGDADDVTLGYTSPASVQRWGAHASDIDTSLYNAPGLDDATARRAREIMSALSNPIYNVNRITWNAQQDLSKLEKLDLFSVVQVEYGDLTQTARVVSLSHKITPTRWEVDIDFTDIRAGASYADFYDRYQGLTYAQFDALWRGKTHQAFDASPTVTPPAPAAARYDTATFDGTAIFA